MASEGVPPLLAVEVEGVRPTTTPGRRSTGRPHDRGSSQRWSTFVRNHASAMLACDFFVTITASFRTVYVFVVLHVGTRRIVHWNVTEYPTASWTVQRFRPIVLGEQPERFLIHNRDTIFAAAVDDAVTAMGLTC